MSTYSTQQVERKNTRTRGKTMKRMRTIVQKRLWRQSSFAITKLIKYERWLLAFHLSKIMRWHVCILLNRYVHVSIYTNTHQNIELWKLWSVLEGIVSIPYISFLNSCCILKYEFVFTYIVYYGINMFSNMMV